MRQISNSLAVRHSVLRARGHARLDLIRALGPKLGSTWAWAALLATIGVFLCSGRARAEPELSLSWSTKEALPSCPDRAWAITRVESEIKRAPAADVTEGVHAIVEIEKSGSGFLISVRTQVGSARGERTIEGASCRELSEAAILIVALSVAEAGDERARAGDKDAGGDAASSSAKSAAQPREQASKTTRLGFLMRPEIVADFGLLGSQPMLGPGLALGLEWGRYRAELLGTWLVYGTLQTKGEEIALRLGAARVSGCALFGVGRVRGGPCLGVELGQVRGRNTNSGVQNPTFWGATNLTGRLLVKLGWRLALVLDADLVASWGRVTLLRATDDGSETLYRSNAWQLRTHLGLEISF